MEVWNEHIECHSHVNNTNYLLLYVLLARKQRTWNEKSRIDLYSYIGNCFHDSFNCSANIFVNLYSFSFDSGFRSIIDL